MKESEKKVLLELLKEEQSGTELMTKVGLTVSWTYTAIKNLTNDGLVEVSKITGIKKTLKLTDKGIVTAKKLKDIKTIEETI